jgi:hypothetical protein
LLIFVGANGGGAYGDALDAAVAASPRPGQIRITGWTDADTYHAYLAAADVGVQLRTQSRGETSAAALDCMNYGLATVVNAHGGMAELASDVVWRLPDAFGNDELATALTVLWKDEALRKRFGAAARALLADAHAPAACAERYAAAIERSYSNAAQGLNGVLVQLAGVATSPGELGAFAQSAARTFPPHPRLRQCLVLLDARFRQGPQRLREKRLVEWMKVMPPGWVLEPVYLDEPQQCLRYARKWTCSTLGVTDAWAQDLPVDAWRQDVLFQRMDVATKHGEPSLAMEWLTACGVLVQECASLDSVGADPIEMVKLIQNLAVR